MFFGEYVLEEFSISSCLSHNLTVGRGCGDKGTDTKTLNKQKKKKERRRAEENCDAAENVMDYPERTILKSPEVVFHA